MKAKLANWAEAWGRDLAKETPLVKDFRQKECEFFLSNIPKNASIIEAGCGEGRVLAFLSNRAGRLVGVDINREVLERAKKKTCGVKNVELFCENILNTHFKASSFDCCIFSMNTFGNLYKDKVSALKEAARITKPGGKIFIAVYSENALSERLEHYNGLFDYEIINREKGTVKLFCSFDGKNSIITEQFTKEELGELFKKAGFTGFSIKPLNAVSYICEIRVKK